LQIKITKSAQPYNEQLIRISDKLKTRRFILMQCYLHLHTLHQKRTIKIDLHLQSWLLELDLRLKGLGFKSRSLINLLKLWQCSTTGKVTGQGGEVSCDSHNTSISSVSVIVLWFIV